MKPLIAVTMGDASGIGPEISVKAVLKEEIQDICRVIIIGDAGVLEKQSSGTMPNCTGITETGIRRINEPGEAKHRKNIIDVLDLKLPGMDGIEMGKASAITGKASVEYVKKAVQMALNKEVSAIVTAPWCKESVFMAGNKFTGHTEFIAELAGVKDFAMMIAGGSMRTVLVTGHLPLNEVSKNLNEDKIYRVIMLTNNSLKELFGNAVRIAVTGLNPHTGENGILGKEEKDIIRPAVEHARREGVNVNGPIAADKVIYDTAGSRYDVAVVMYHDQALIPVKLLAFNRSINVTLGLPFIRTSPCHGTAFDIAGKNMADPRSMVEAIKFAVKNEKTLGTKFSCRP